MDLLWLSWKRDKILVSVCNSDNECILQLTRWSLYANEIYSQGLWASVTQCMNGVMMRKTALVYLFPIIYSLHCTQLWAKKFWTSETNADILCQGNTPGREGVTGLLFWCYCANIDIMLVYRPISRQPLSHTTYDQEPEEGKYPSTSDWHIPTRKTMDFKQNRIYKCTLLPFPGCWPSLYGYCGRGNPLRVNETQLILY